jgi:CcmD family protein
MIRSFSLLLVLVSSTLATAQASSMEDYMYSSGKINVVIAVVLIILVLLFIYLFRLDKKVKEMEK